MIIYKEILGLTFNSRYTTNVKYLCMEYEKSTKIVEDLPVYILQPQYFQPKQKEH